MTLKYSQLDCISLTKLHDYNYKFIQIFNAAFKPSKFELQILLSVCSLGMWCQVRLIMDERCFKFCRKLSFGSSRYKV